jgi:hypothetical protein
VVTDGDFVDVFKHNKTELLLMKLALLSLLFFLNVTTAFFSETHQYLGDTLYNNLPLKIVEHIMGETTLTNFHQASTWADVVKHSREFSWSSELHYVDTLDCDYHNVNLYCGERCILTGILNMTNAIRYNKDYMTVKEHENTLKFLIHFLQDFFQPLHLLGEFRGGNNYHVILEKHQKNVSTNMHAVWDKYMPEEYIKEIDSKQINDESNSGVEIKSIIEYQKYLVNTTKDYLALICSTNLFMKNILFDKYYSEKKYIIKTAFKTYARFAKNTFLFAYGGFKENKLKAN